MNTLLIVGFGDIARRSLPLLAGRLRILALLRPESVGAIPRQRGVVLEAGDLDDADSLRRFAGRANLVLHCAPPPRTGTTDPRTANLLAALAASALPQRLVYISTSGVYGDCAGAWVNEGRALNPATDRARRRVDAEARIAAFGRTRGVRCVILRAPGIYAPDRLPLERLRQGTPVLRAEDDVYTNHVHADDLAAIVAVALTHPDAQGICNACDDTPLKMGDWFDLLADRAGLPRPPRIAREQAQDRIPASLLSFMSESRRLSNRRMKETLGVQLRYRTVQDGLLAARAGSSACASAPWSP
ncbi:MAG: NAD(P)H-binding protein [Burkholderiales bacterium]|nr:NAD(P)H-binding protein [Burkholderiales bacterium]